MECSPKGGTAALKLSSNPEKGKKQSSIINFFSKSSQNNKAIGKLLSRRSKHEKSFDATIEKKKAFAVKQAMAVYQRGAPDRPKA